jgi:hypothetical protein
MDTWFGCLSTLFYVSRIIDSFLVKSVISSAFVLGAFRIVKHF